MPARSQVAHGKAVQARVMGGRLAQRDYFSGQLATSAPEGWGSLGV